MCRGIRTGRTDGLESVNCIHAASHIPDTAKQNRASLYCFLRGNCAGRIACNRRRFAFCGIAACVCRNLDPVVQILACIVGAPDAK